jgi:RNA methyltransferase, TrmH family
MLVEGIRPVRELLSSRLQVHVILISLDAFESPEIQELRNEFHGRTDVVLSTSPPVFQQAADTESPQGILAIAELPDWSGFTPDEANPLILIVDQVRDPGNLGTLIRSSRGAQCSVVLVGRNSADPYSPKVVRASAGSVLHMPVLTLDWDKQPEWLRDVTIYVTEADAEFFYDDIDWCQAAAIVVGNETSGVSDAVFSHADGRVGIPLANSLESLNAGVAGSVVLFEAWRQRRRRI